MEYEILLPVTMILVGMLEIIMGLPLLLGKVKPNWIYGFRLPKTLSDDETWYKSNRYVGRDFVVAGIIVILGSMFLLVLNQSFTVTEITQIGVPLLVVPPIIILIRGMVYLRKQ